MADADDRPKSPDVNPDGSLEESPVDPINPETEPSGRYWPVITKYRAIKFVAIVALLGTVAAFPLGVVSVGDVSDGLKSIGDGGPIENVTVTDNNVAVSFPEEHNTDVVAIRHEYDEEFGGEPEVVSVGQDVQEAPRFDGTVMFGTGLGTPFCGESFPTNQFVVAALELDADSAVPVYRTLESRTITVPLDELDCPGD